MLYDKLTDRCLIPKGWSGDKKYRASTSDGETYLRISAEEKAEKTANIFSIQQKVAALGIPMCEPIELGRCEEGIYTVQTWIEGEDAEELLPTLSVETQYSLGMDAGKILKTIHSIPAPNDQPKWEPRFNAKIDRKIRAYQNSPVKFDGSEHIIAYIEANRHLLTNRPQCYQHGDYHVGNMMLSRGRLYIIDFDRYDFGDPWEEFNRIVWCAQAAPEFACGMVDGYFDGAPPMEFWRLLALYISSNMLSSIPWAIPFGEKEISVMLKQASDVLSWYNNMQDPIPSWYHKR